MGIHFMSFQLQHVTYGYARACTWGFPTHNLTVASVPQLGWGLDPASLYIRG